MERILRNKHTVSKKIETVFLVFLFSVAILKIYLIAFANPVMGYANNWDFIRQSTCTGIWMNYQEKKKEEGNPEKFINSLSNDGEKHRWRCLTSSDNLATHLVAKLHSKGGDVDFREIAFVRICMLFLSLLAFLLMFWKKYFIIPLVASFFLVFGDLANILYLNTLYTEFSIVALIFINTILLCRIIADKGKISTLQWGFAILMVAFLGGAKQQSVPLASFFALVFAFLAWKRKSPMKISVLWIGVAAVIPAFSILINSSIISDESSASNANKTNTFMAAVLPAAKNKMDALKTLGLPGHCMAAIGESWYSEKLKEGMLCPEVSKISRIKLLPLFLSQPETLTHPVSNFLSFLNPFYPEGYLAHTSSPEHKNMWKYKFVRETSSTFFMSNLAFPDGKASGVYITISVLIFIIAPIVFLLSIFSQSNPAMKFNLALAGTGGIIMAYAIFSSVFGDGYIEAQKHAVAFPVGFSFILASGLFFFLQFIRKLIPNGLRDSIFSRTDHF